MKNTLLQYVLIIFLSLILYSIVEALMFLLPNLGWHIVTIFFILILLSQLLFYYLTGRQKWRLLTVSFLINYLLWTVELIKLEKQFGTSPFYLEDGLRFMLYALCGLLWVSNKLILDFFFKIAGYVDPRPNKIDVLLNKRVKTSEEEISPSADNK